MVIFDRYIYDELANLPLQNRLTRAFIQLLLKLVPKPDVAYLIDADPAAAFARKPEYPIEFLHRNRQAYLTLSDLAGCVTIIEPQSVEAMELKVRDALLREVPVPVQDLPRLPVLQQGE